eukprot:6489346-Amphidinium_carterae.1
MKAAQSPAQATAFRKFCTGSFLCHEREARHAQKAEVSPLCSLCGCLDTMTHIVYECRMLPDRHRDYINQVCDEGARELLIRTGLPIACAELEKLGEKQYLHFTHRVSAALVRRNILSAAAPAIHPVKKRLCFKQKRPWAYRVDGTTRLTPKSRKGPNLDQRASMDFSLDADGAWHINGHVVRPADLSAEPRLTCDVCCITSVWRLKKVFYSSICDCRPRQVHCSRLASAGEHIMKEKSVLTCMGCGGTGHTKHSAHFVKAHRLCEEVWRDCI